MKEIAGGLWLGALCTGALLGFIPGMILFIIGTLFALCELEKEHLHDKRAANQWKNYPPYGY